MTTLHTYIHCLFRLMCYLKCRPNTFTIELSRLFKGYFNSSQTVNWTHLLWHYKLGCGQRRNMLNKKKVSAPSVSVLNYSLMCLETNETLQHLLHRVDCQWRTLNYKRALSRYIVTWGWQCVPNKLGERWIHAHYLTGISEPNYVGAIKSLIKKTNV